MGLAFTLRINIWCSADSFCDTPIESVDWVVTVPHYTLIKFFNYIAALGDVILVLIGEIFVFSLHYNFIWRNLNAIYFRDLGEFSLTFESYT